MSNAINQPYEGMILFFEGYFSIVRKYAFDATFGKGYFVYLKGDLYGTPRNITECTAHPITYCGQLEMFSDSVIYALDPTVKKSDRAMNAALCCGND
jgi:hypothetical protein